MLVTRSGFRCRLPDAENGINPIRQEGQACNQCNVNLANNVCEVDIGLVIHDRAAMDENRLYEALGRSIAAHRKALGKTQAEIASKLSLSRASLANIERGNQKVLLHQIYKIAEALELTSISQLIPIHLDIEQDNQEIAIISTGDSLTVEQMSQLERFVFKSTLNSEIGKSNVK